MKMFTTSCLLFLLMAVNQLYAQYQEDNPNLDQIPRYLRERVAVSSDSPLSSVVTIGNWDNFSLGVDFAENNMAENPNNPPWYFTAYNYNAPYNTQNGLDWFNNTASFGTTVQGDPVVAYDSIGNLYYENMSGNITGCTVIKSTDNGNTWGSPVAAISGSDKNWLACDQTSGPYANYVYSTMSNNGVGNFTRSLDNGATFNSTFAPTTQLLPGMMVAVGPEGNIQGGAVYVVTNSGTAFNAIYTFYRSNDGGATFSQRSAQQWANTVGTQVGTRSSVSNMRTRPYPMIAADNSYGASRGKFYCVYASNDPPGSNNKSDVWCRSSSDGGATWTNAIRVNDDANSQNFQQWHPAIWCDKETGKLYVMWMDTRDTPTNDSAYIYATYSTDGGSTFVPNQRISNKKMKIDCGTCGGGGTPRYEGDYNGVISNKKGSMIGWTDFRDGSFQGMTAYLPDFAMAIDHAADTLYFPIDTTTFQVSIPEVKLYADTVILSGNITPVPTSGNISFEFPSGTTITSYPASLPVKLVLTGGVPTGTYTANFVATGPNGTPAHRRTATIKVMPGNGFMAIASATPAAICEGQTSQLNAEVMGGTPPFTYAWTPTEGLSNPAIGNPVATPNITTTYHVAVSDNAAHTSVDSVAVTVNIPPAAPGPVTGSQSVCAGSTTNYSIVEVVGGTTYSWTVQGDAAIVSGQNTPHISVKWGNSSGSIQVIAGNYCGNNPIASILPVVVNPAPAPLNPVSWNGQVCKNSNASFFVVNADNSLSFTWTIPADAILLSGQGSNSIVVTWGNANGDVSVFAQNGCGVGQPVVKSVVASTIPDPAGAITGKDTICLGTANIVYSVPAINGATEYIWTTPVGVTITAGMGTSQVTLQYGTSAQAGNISVKGTSDCGDGTGSVKAVNVKNCTGIDQKGLEATVRIYPNPVRNELTLRINGTEKQLNLSVTNASGQVMYAEKLTGITADYMKQLDMSAFPKGVYFLKLSDNNRVYMEKVIVQ
jgi:hypothetical protein